MNPSIILLAIITIFLGGLFSTSYGSVFKKNSKTFSIRTGEKQTKAYSPGASHPNAWKPSGTQQSGRHFYYNHVYFTGGSPTHLNTKRSIISIESSLETGRNQSPSTQPSPCDYKSEAINWRIERHKQNQVATIPKPPSTFPRYAPVVGVRALSNLQVFFAHMFENLVAIREADLISPTSKRVKEHPPGGPPFNEHLPTGIRCIVPSQPLPNTPPQYQPSHSSNPPNYSSQPTSPLAHHPINLLSKDEKSRLSSHTPRIPPWDPAWKWDGIFLGKRKKAISGLIT